MEKVKLRVDRINDLYQAVSMIAAIDDLEQKDVYWLGRLGDFCSNPVKNLTKGREKLQRVLQTKNKALTEAYSKVTDKQSKEALDLLEQINDLNDTFSTKVQALLDQEEEIQIPEFKLSSFAAKEDIVRVLEMDDKNEKNEVVKRKIDFKIKKGQSLVPVHFYKLMGEFIKEG